MNLLFKFPWNKTEKTFSVYSSCYSARFSHKATLKTDENESKISWWQQNTPQVYRCRATNNKLFSIRIETHQNCFLYFFFNCALFACKMSQQLSNKHIYVYIDRLTIPKYTWLNRKFICHIVETSLSDTREKSCSMLIFYLQRENLEWEKNKRGIRRIKKQHSVQFITILTAVWKAHSFLPIRQE